MKKLLSIVCVASLLALDAQAQSNSRAVQARFIRPSVTDPAITQFNDEHFVALTSSTTTRLNKLFLHLPGTGHEPWQATNWVLTAASLGFHAISLKYANVPSIGALCTTNANQDCFRAVAEENISGSYWEDHDPSAIKHVTRTDSITNRVVKLLSFLSTNPLTASEGWNQFLGPDGVQWGKVALSGHSQGGSCALLLSKMHAVDRAVLFATVDWSRVPVDNRPAWFVLPGKTPPERLYGFTHLNDFGGENRERQPIIWQDLGMTAFGPIIRVETNAPPFLGSHTLTTQLRPASTNDSGGLEYHGSVIIDRAIPTSPNDRVIWEPVWSYMLTNVTAPLPPPPIAKTHVVTVNADGSFTPSRVELLSGDTVEWRFATRGQAIIPVQLDAAGRPDCIHPMPYNPTDPNEFTGPLPQAVSGLFSLSPEETPYRSKEETWASTNLAGVFIRPRWDDVHRGPGQFNWVEVDAEIAQAVRHGKLFSIAFKAGAKGTPQWIFDPTKTSSPVVPLDFGLRSEGKPALFGSPADPNFRQHYFDMLRAFATHLRANNAHYRALAYIKPSGANLHSHENRLPNDTTEQLATWAGPGRYTPSALYEFYRLQEELMLAEFPGKSLNYALIQDGFPIINDFGEYLGQPAAPLHPLPTGAGQTEALLAQGRINFGLRFVVAHNGLLRKPPFCPGSGSHPIAIDPSFHYVGSGCPNRWVLEQAAAGQITGFQTINDLVTDRDVDSALENGWDNSDGVYVELYEHNALQIEGKVLPSGKTSGQWAQNFHERRRTTFPTVPDPFPLAHRHTFTRSGGGSSPRSFFYVTGNPCPIGTTAKTGEVVLLPELSFAGIALEHGNSVRLNVQSTRAGILRLESSADLLTWGVIRTQSISAGSLELTVPALGNPAQFYRVTVTP